MSEEIIISYLLIAHVKETHSVELMYKFGKTTDPSLVTVEWDGRLWLKIKMKKWSLPRVFGRTDQDKNHRKLLGEINMSITVSGKEM